MAREKETRNVLDMIPEREHEWEEKKDKGTVTLKMPRFKSRVGRWFCRQIKKEPTVNVNLDKYGSEAWKLCDGERTVRAIGKALSEKFGKDVEPINERIAELFNIMEANKLITYKRDE